MTMNKLFSAKAAVMLCAAAALLAAEAYPRDLLDGPWSENAAQGAVETKLNVFSESMDRQAGVFVLLIYQKLVSPQLNTNCQFYPSCSEYAKQSVIKYGVLKGYTMGIERLMRCNRWAKEYYYPKIKIGSRYRLLDLPESNLLTRNSSKGDKK
jgi:uncharacterized protein